MKHYTVVADKPKGPDYPGTIVHNCVNQKILWDYRANTSEIRKLAALARNHFEVVQVFAGKHLGRLTDL